MKRKIIFGASLSIKQCRNFNIDHLKVLEAAASDLGIKRFRLMSYWDEIEKVRGTYDFDFLDEEITFIERAGGQITLCLGARQPRWPESHWPGWTKNLSTTERNDELMKFITAVVKRYRNRTVVKSWQLENEALLKDFGENGDFDRKRIREEFKLVKKLGARKPVIMTTSTSWGIPLRRPIPDIIGFSYYDVVYNKGAYRRSIFQPWVFRLRALLIKIIWRRDCFIHEMQAEPWGPKNIWDMPAKKQAESMDPNKFKENITRSIQTKLKTIDMWGLEWWYWRKINYDDSAMWDTVKKYIVR